MRTITVAVGLMLIVPGLAQAQDAEADACHQKQTTIDITQCLVTLTAKWDTRLNAAYKAAMNASDSEARKAALVRAEVAWIKYRDENCGWYGARQGTIRQIFAADCLLTMTKARAAELEEAIRL
jgi:uncharacterized protein YecT (DUF1311 family)